jgi:tryptophan-rich sensory protein
LALYCIFGLWAAVALCVIVFWQYSWIAGLAFVPYLLWVSVAALLNRSVCRLNAELT